MRATLRSTQTPYSRSAVHQTSSMRSTGAAGANVSSTISPVYIVEVDERVPALRKDTLTVVDDRDPDTDTDALQPSNFYVFENRETGEIELYLIRYGERASHWTHADAHKYTITLL